MKKLMLVSALLSSALFVSACDNAKTAPILKDISVQQVEQPKIAGLSIEDGKAIDNGLMQLGADFKAGKWDTSIKAMPPALVENLAKQANMPKEELEKALTEMVASLGQAAKVEEYTYQLDKAVAKKSSNGRDYVFVPNQLKANMQGQNVSTDGYLLALKDIGKWYFVNWDQQYAPLLKQVYSDLADIQPPTNN